MNSSTAVVRPPTPPRPSHRARTIVRAIVPGSSSSSSSRADPPAAASSSVASTTTTAIDASSTCPSYFDDIDSDDDSGAECDSMLKCGICFHEYEVASPATTTSSSTSRGDDPDRRPCLSRTCCHSLCFACARDMVMTAQGRDGHCPFCRQPLAFPTRLRSPNQNNNVKVVNHLTMRLLLLHTKHQNEKMLKAAEAEAAAFVVTKKDASTQLGKGLAELKKKSTSVAAATTATSTTTAGSGAVSSASSSVSVASAATATTDDSFVAAKRPAISSGRTSQHGFQLGRPKYPPTTTSHRNRTTRDASTTASSGETTTGVVTPAGTLPSPLPRASEGATVVTPATGPSSSVASTLASSSPSSLAWAFNAGPVEFRVGVVSDKKKKSYSGGSPVSPIASPVSVTSLHRAGQPRPTMGRLRLEERFEVRPVQVPTLIKDPIHPSNVPDNSNRLFELVSERKWVDAHLRAQRHPDEAKVRFAARGRVITLVHAAIFFGAPYALVGLLVEMDPTALLVRSWFMDKGEKLLPVDWAVQLFRLDLIRILRPRKFSLVKAMAAISLSDSSALSFNCSIESTIPGLQSDADLPASIAKSDDLSTSNGVPSMDRTDDPVAAATPTESKPPSRDAEEGTSRASPTSVATDESADQANGQLKVVPQIDPSAMGSTAGLTESTGAKDAAAATQVSDMPASDTSRDMSAVEEFKALVAASSTEVCEATSGRRRINSKRP